MPGLDRLHFRRREELDHSRRIGCIQLRFALVLFECDARVLERAQVGFDLFFQSGVTRGLPAVIPVAVLFDTPENAAAEIAYLKKRGYCCGNGCRHCPYDK